MKLGYHYMKLATALVLFFGLGIVIHANAQQTGATKYSPYDLAPNWPRMAHPYARPGYVLGSQGGIFAETPNRIFLASRGELKLPEQLPSTFNGFWGSLAKPGTQPNANIQLPEMRNTILVVDAEGALVESWTQWDHLFAEGRGPHSIRISPFDPQRHVWVIDDYHHQIFEFTNDGKNLVRTLGERDIAGDDETHFRRPTDIDWLPDGTFFVTDGYGNARVVKFDKNARFVLAWGTRGKDVGQLDTPHGIAVGPDRRVYVSDRSNKRIHVFDENGKYVAHWSKIMAQTLLMSDIGHLWLYDSDRDMYVEYDLGGKELSSFHIPDTFSHQLSADVAGNIYGAGSRHGQPFKLRPRSGVSAAKLLRPVALMGAQVSRVPGRIDYVGAWTLSRAEPARTTAADVFGATASDLSLTITGDILTVGERNRRVNFNLNGADIINSEYMDIATGVQAVTTMAWENGKLMLFIRQGLNLQKDILTTDGRALNISRDINTAGGSYVINLTYVRP